MATDAPDWQRVVKLVSGAVTTDAPDWERVVTGPGGTPAGGFYASLTGTGETVTPGNLAQAGGFLVDDPATNDGIIGLTERSANGVVIQCIGPGQILIQATSGGIEINTGAAALKIIGTLPTSDPHTVGQFWNNAGICTISAG